MYATLLGLLGLGASVVFVEPWMEMRSVDRVVALARPKAFVGGFMGRLWGLRIPAIRKIPHWVSIRRLRTSTSKVHVESVSSDTWGIVAFSSGTTGTPRGVVRTHGYLDGLHDIFSHCDDAWDSYQGPDLSVFPNVSANEVHGFPAGTLSPWRAS